MLRIAGMTAVSLLLAVAACAKQEASQGTNPNAPPSATAAVLGIAEIRDSSGKLLGVVSLNQTDAGISLSGKLVGLAPGEHGMHLHSVGLCEGPDFTSAGGHWNPTGKMHGVSNADGPHQGDLPNLMVTPDSVGLVVGVTAGGKFKSDSSGLIDKDGAAVVIHAGRDDYKTDPSGNSGARIACGVIVAKK